MAFRRTARFCIASLLLSLAFLIIVRRTFWGSAVPADACTVALRYPVSANPALPKITHQQWKNGEMPPHFAAWRASMMDIFKEHVHMLWTDETQRALIAAEYAWFLPTYDALPSTIMRVDAARCFIMHKFGGLYLDLDYEVLKDFWGRLPDDAPAFVESYWGPAYEIHQNSLMSSPPNSDFWRYTWEIIAERAKTGSTNPIFVTGPAMIDTAMELFPGKSVSLACENWQRPAIGDDSVHTAFKHRAWRSFAYYAGLFRECGSNDADRECLFGIHHSTITWN